MAIFFTPAEVANFYKAGVPKLAQGPGWEWRGPCPIHAGERDSFSVDKQTGRWFCHSECGRGGDIIGLHQELTSTDFVTAKTEVFRLVGRIEPEYRHNGTHMNGNPRGGTRPSKPTKANAKADGWREIDSYPYTDEAGKLLFEVVRQERGEGAQCEKKFLQRRPSATGGWIWKLDGVRRVPYRLPLVVNADTVYLPEGEKDVHTLEQWGLVASCNAGGAGKWRAEYSSYFAGKQVVILADNDEPGRKHAVQVASALLSVATSIRVVELPDLPEKGDVTDWRDVGGDLDQLIEIVEAAAPLDVAALSELRTRWATASEEPEHEAARANTPDIGSLITRCMAGIESKPVSWLWPDRIPRGKLTVIAGDPGLGKSQITASIAAVVTTGGDWPGDREQCQTGKVLFLTAEDDPADTLRPRLEAAGADVNRVHVIDGVTRGFTGEGDRQGRAFSLEKDLQALDAKLAEIGHVAVVVIDPISAYLGNADSHKNAEVRALMTPLSELAARHDVAIIAVSHLSKAESRKALMRVNGSLAFVAAARAAYLVAADPQDHARRLFLPMKNNLGPDSTGLAFRIEGVTIDTAAGSLATSRVSWESEPVSITADQALDTERKPKRSSALDQAKEWLEDALADGPMAAEDVVDRAKEDGISEKTLRRASKALELRKEKAGMDGGWSWSLSPKVAISFEDAQDWDVATFDEVGHLLETESGVVELQLFDDQPVDYPD